MKRTGVSSKIWRTVVVASAMLTTPLIMPLAACGRADKNGATTPTAPPVEPGPSAEPVEPAAAAEDQAAAELQAQREAEERAAAEAQAQREAEERAAAEARAKEEAEANKPRPRVTPVRPSGRGFILA